MNANTIIRLENISVCYEIPNEPITSLKEYAIRYIQGKVGNKKFLALSNINLEISRGEFLGIIGRNGAGKSTLLKVITRIIPIHEGRLIVLGSVSPLMEVGAGFHPELTGLENVFLNGTLLGHSRREIHKKMDEILDFAAITDFINAPVRTYSSGMVARLGFAVATAWQPDILILDESLAVGDKDFQNKCRERMHTLHSTGTTILLVTHDTNTVRSLCTRAIWIEQGLLRMSGEAEFVITSYLIN